MPTPVADPRQLQIHRAQPMRDVPYVPTEPPVVDAMLRMAGVGAGDVVYDLGCGDGRIAIAAARLGARAVGIDIDLQRIKECYWNARKAGVGGGRVQFVRQSLFDVDFRDASVVTLYLLTTLNLRLRPKLLWELRPGSRIVSNYFDMGHWQPDERLETHHRVLYRWTIPAWAAGRWKCVVDGPAGRWHFKLELHARFQQVWGAAGVERKGVPLEDAKLDGAELSFALPAVDGTRGRVEFRGRVEGNFLRGTCRFIGDASSRCAWGGVRA